MKYILILFLLIGCSEDYIVREKYCETLPEPHYLPPCICKYYIKNHGFSDSCHFYNVGDTTYIRNKIIRKLE